MKQKLTEMNKTKSFFLEIVRVVASFYVFICHIGYEELNGTQYFSNKSFITFFNIRQETAHCFVLIFFLLSGYLISMSALKPGITFKKFIINRLGRIYSVMLPALFFSFIVAYIIKLHVSYFIPHMNSNFLRFFLNFFFLSESLNLSSSPPFNGAFWSVQYEVMYYFIFGVFVFLKSRLKYVCILLLLALCFPKILLLFPIWLLGSLLYKLDFRIEIPKIIFSTIFILSSLLLLICLVYPEYIPFQKMYNNNTLFNVQLYLSWNYKSDFIFGILVFVNFYTFFQISEKINFVVNKKYFDFIFKKIQMLGNCSYTLYLFHMPLIYLLATIFPYDKNNYYHIFLLILAVMVLVYLIARLTEWKVTFWRNRVAYIINFFSNKLNT